MQCAFCESKDIEQRIIVKNSLAYAFPTNIPIVPGHLLIAPIRCVTTWEEMKHEEQHAILELMEKIKPVLKKEFGAQGFHVAWNEGVVAGQSVLHFHLHLIPRKQADTGITDYEPRKFIYRPGSREISEEKELQKVSEIIKRALEQEKE